MDTDDDVSTFEEEEASLSETENILSGVGLGLSSESDTIGLEDGEESCLEGIHLKQDILLAANAEDERVKFQVMCAHTEVSDVEKYVVYTIDIERGEDNRPALLERRYTDFLSLYRSLKHSYPALMSHIKFPRKVIIGNFKIGVIEKRSTRFESFLSYVYSKDVLRCSEPFNSFLYRRELRESSHQLLHSEFESAIPILENLYWLLSKLHGDRDQLLRVLLQLIVCLHAVGNYELSHDYCLLALPRFEARLIDGNTLAKELYVPFLQFCLRVWWILGRNKTIFEIKLENVRKEGQRIDGFPDLLDCLRDEINIPSIHS
ncbi:Sorting nexin-21 [Armadillidium vulgare]|nr:Sorting nexin-21 [Armadillidium vulgare]